FVNNSTLSKSRALSTRPWDLTTDNLDGHQRQQRRNDEPHAGANDRGNLVAERFTAARRHQHEGIVAGNDVLDDARLWSPERIIAINGLEDFEGGGGHGRQHGESRKWSF